MKRRADAASLLTGPARLPMRNDLWPPGYARGARWPHPRPGAPRLGWAFLPDLLRSLRDEPGRRCAPLAACGGANANRRAGRPGRGGGRGCPAGCSTGVAGQVLGVGPGGGSGPTAGASASWSTASAAGPGDVGGVLVGHQRSKWVSRPRARSKSVTAVPASSSAAVRRSSSWTSVEPVGARSTAPCARFGSWSWKPRRPGRHHRSMPPSAPTSVPVAAGSSAAAGTRSRRVPRNAVLDVGSSHLLCRRH